MAVDYLQQESNRVNRNEQNLLSLNNQNMSIFLHDPRRLDLIALSVYIKRCGIIQHL